MKILFDVGHPAQVHFYKNAAKILKKDGHQVLFSARNKEVLIDLLKLNDLEYHQISSQRSGFWGLSLELFQRVIRLLALIRKFEPDLLCGPGETVALAGKLSRTPVILFNDSEPVPINKFLTYPFVTLICTPVSFRENLGKKQIRYNGYKELAYLHPKYFTPNVRVLQELNLAEGDPFILIRFVSWQARHDKGHHGIQNKERIVQMLEKYGKVFISSESPLPQSLERYQLHISPEKLHDVLYYAKLIFCDSQTMATEAAVLGTPAIRCNSFVGHNDMGNFLELEQKYELIYNFNDECKALETANCLLQKKDLKLQWKEKRETLLKEKIDVSTFIVESVEKYTKYIEKINTPYE